MTQADLKEEIAQMVEQGKELITIMHHLRTDVQQNMADLAAQGKQLEQVIRAGEKSSRHIQHVAGLMADFYLSEIESLFQDGEVDLTPEQRQQVLVLRDSLRDLRTEMAADNTAPPGDTPRATVTSGLANSTFESAQQTELLDRAFSPTKHPKDEVLVLLIRHGSRAKPPEDDRIARAIQRVRQSCRDGREGETEWPFPQGWMWATDDCDQRSRAVADLLTPLNQDGENQTQQRALWLQPLLAPLDLDTTVFLSSHYKHAQDMANQLGKLCVPGEVQPRVLALRSLSPNSKSETFEDILAEAEQQGIDLLQQRLVVCVGHEPRLSQLYTRLTGKRTRPFNRADVVAVGAASWVKLRAGAGQQKFRLPVADHQEEALRSKVHSKMTVASLLTGFAAAVLFDMLLSGMDSPLRQLAGILITASLALFMAVLYMYDRLSMPEGFWVNEDRPGRFRWIFKGRDFQRDHEQHGPLYAHMVWTWQFVFTLAVFLALVGFLILVSEIRSIWLLPGVGATLVAVWWFYLVTRPRLGTD